MYLASHKPCGYAENFKLVRRRRRVALKLSFATHSMDLPHDVSKCSLVISTRCMVHMLCLSQVMSPIVCWSNAGGQWQAALELFRAMDSMGLPRDAITYSSVISALAKGKQWAHALQAGHP